MGFYKNFFLLFCFVLLFCFRFFFFFLKTWLYWCSVKEDMWGFANKQHFFYFEKNSTKKYPNLKENNNYFCFWLLCFFSIFFAAS